MSSDSLHSRPIEQQVGQFFYIGLPGTELDAETRALIEEVQPGGIIIFGLTPPDDNTGPHKFDGMTPADYQSFNQDDVMAKVNAHASPSIDLTVHHESGIDGKQCVVIEVRKFADYPVIC